MTPLPRRPLALLSTLVLAAALGACTEAGSNATESGSDGAGVSGRADAEEGGTGEGADGGDDGGDDGDDGDATVSPQVASAGEPETVLAGTDPADLALAVSQTLYEQSPVLVVAAEDDAGSHARAASLAVALGTPMLFTGARPQELAEEVERLDASHVVAVGTQAEQQAGSLDATVVPAPDDAAALAQSLGAELGETAEVELAGLTAAVAGLERESPQVLSLAAGSQDAPGQDEQAGEEEQAGEDEQAGELPQVEPAQISDPPVVMVTGDPGDVAAAATARAAGATVLVTPGGDPRSTSEAVNALAAEPPASVIGVGDAFGDAQTLRRRTEVAATGVELPGGGQLVYPGRVLVALYGHPGAPSLGVLGEQPVEAAIERARTVAAEYEPYSFVPVVPAFEIITTVASSSAGADGDYSNEADIELIRPWVDAAREAGVYVVLDLQPGRSDFLTQAKRYQELLVQPHVGLALDPEWRLRPDQVHLRQIGSVNAAEVNSVITWLADLTAENQLPQKLLILHQFRLSMIPDRDQVDTSRDELAILVHGDGNGTPDLKFATWANLTRDLPAGMWLGWKNFYDEDSPTFTPEQTMDVRPQPLFISYQ